MSRSKLYLFIIITCFAGFSYLFYKTIYISNNEKLSTTCIVKNITGYACPSCGTTRAIQLIMKNNWMASLHVNPFGILVVTMMICFPLWIFFDIILKKSTFYIYYNRAEKIIRIKWVAALLISIVIINWIWNIKKGL